MVDPEAPQTGGATESPLARLRLAPGRQKIPVILQLNAQECGAACLAMVLGYHGRSVSLDDLRGAMAFDRGATSADAILAAARAHGLNGRGVRVEVEDLAYLDEASILHWEFSHFVVFQRVTRRGVEIIDPALGRRLVPLEQFRRSFTGVALLLEPAEHFQAKAADRRQLWRHAWRLMRGAHLAPILVTSLLVQLFALGVPILTGRWSIASSPGRTTTC